MSAELVKHQPAAPATLPEKMQYAKALAASGMLPGQYRQQPANLLYALEYAESLGLHPMAAITGVHVIEGKPSASSALISALVRRAGHKLRVTGNDQRAVAQIVRADDPDFTFEAVWTMDRAEQAGLARKQVWKNYPAAMLKARAITEVARDACEEALSGMHYTPEELGANVDAEGNPVDAEVQQLRRVPVSEGDPWTTSSPAERGAPQGTTVIAPDTFRPYAPAQELADKAAGLTSRDDLTLLRDEAQDAGVSADAGVLAPDTKQPDTLREYLKRRWLALPKQAEQQDDGVVDVEIVPDEQPEVDEHAAAVAELRAFAAEHGIDDIDRDAYGALGAPLADVSAKAIRGLLGQLRGTAA
ncbi:hypothetical protein [Streptomyces sp. NPDC005322]|uniref:hypothetical protein n=1 Tax=Streptomyces sp. NPDC005322 TaxID=3157032 RepID=UPI0033A9CC98